MKMLQHEVFQGLRRAVNNKGVIFSLRPCNYCRLSHYKEHSRSEFSTLFHTRQFHQTTFLYRQTIQSLFRKETGLRISLLTHKATRKLHKEWSKLYASSSNGVQSDDPKVQNQKEGDQSSKKKQSKTDTIVKVIPKITLKDKKSDDDFYDNNLITPLRAMRDWMLTMDDLEQIQQIKRRSPYPEREDIVVLLRKDVLRVAMEKFGSLENLENLQAIKTKSEASQRMSSRQNRSHEPLSPEYEAIIKKASSESIFTIFSDGPGRVVAYAIIINGTLAVLKFITWHHTGYSSLFAEFLHSSADTINQLILAFGIYQSKKQADLEHPYGWSNFQNVASLISGVGIFCFGAGLSIYHGIHSLLQPAEMESLFLAISILGVSAFFEAITLGIAMNQVKKSAKAKEMSPWRYVWRSEDPSTNVVLLEDLSAVFGVGIAAGCISMSHFMLTHIPDAVGSILIGTLLGTTASFIIYTNTVALVGRSVLPDKKQKMMKVIEDDRLVRQLHDVKATDIGGSFIRFKAEVDFDGKEVTRKYLETQDAEELYKELQRFTTPEELENFLIVHGSNIVDQLGSEVDRIEKKLKDRHPEVRHVDLEHL